MKFVYFFLVTMFVVSSCSNGDTDIYTANIADKSNDTSLSSAHLTDDVLIISSFEDLAKYSEVQYPYELNRATHQLSPRVDDDYHSISGFTREWIFKGDQKMMFQKNFADKLGVSSTTVYIARVIQYELNVPNPQNKYLFEAESPRCGGKPTMNSDNVSVSNFATPGYEVIKWGDPCVLATHVLHIKYSFPGGTNVNKYYPRTGNQLVWEYYM